MENAPNEPQTSAIASQDIRLLEKYRCALMSSYSFGLEIEWRKTTAPARWVFPFYEPHFLTLDTDFTREDADLWKNNLERKDTP
jgi:hypothetical protein